METLRGRGRACGSNKQARARHIIRRHYCRCCTRQRLEQGNTDGVDRYPMGKPRGDSFPQCNLMRFLRRVRLAVFCVAVSAMRTALCRTEAGALTGRKSLGFVPSLGCMCRFAPVACGTEVSASLVTVAGSFSRPVRCPKRGRAAIPALVGMPARTLKRRYLVDPASSHMLVSKIKPCMSKYKRASVPSRLRMAH